MKKLNLAICIFLTAFLMLWFMISCSGVNLDTHTNVGRISTIDPVLHRMYIEIPFGMRNLMMMGTLNSNAVFQEDGHPATLSDFKEGDLVLVQWKTAGNGKVIELIER
jgi:hypothetical protein